MKIMRLLKVFTVSSLFLIGCTEGPHRDVIAITNVTVINADRDKFLSKLTQLNLLNFYQSSNNFFFDLNYQFL